MSTKNHTGGGELLRQSEERYRLLVSNVRDYAIFLLDPSGIVQTWNTGAELLKGYTEEEIVGRSFKIFYAQEDIARRHPDDELRLALQNGRYEEEGWRYRKDGSRFWANIVITRLNDDSGRHIGFAKITRDLTERKKAEERLRESEERFRLVVESVRDYAIITLDPSGLITGWNDGARRLKGYETSEVLGRHFSIFYEREDIEVGKAAYELREATATGRFEDEGWRVRKDGTKFWANVVVTAMRDSKGALVGFTKVTRDITERKRAEDKLRMAHETLERRVAERTLELRQAVELRDEFLSIASHELRTPLTALALQHQLFERQIARSNGSGLDIDKARSMGAMIRRQINQLSRLIDDMLDVSRISTGRLPLNMDRQDLSGLVQHVFASFQPQFQVEGVQASLDVQPGMNVSCDPHRIEQVISNLVANAIKYGRRTPIEMSGKVNGSTAEITVRDHGPGIAPGDHDRIFKRFERAVAASEVSGLGLGLFISRQIVEAHGGRIAVESAPGQGAAFKIALPLLPA